MKASSGRKKKENSNTCLCVSRVLNMCVLTWGSGANNRLQGGWVRQRPVGKVIYATSSGFNRPDDPLNSENSFTFHCGQSSNQINLCRAHRGPAQRKVIPSRAPAPCDTFEGCGKGKARGGMLVETVSHPLSRREEEKRARFRRRVFA